MKMRAAFRSIAILSLTIGLGALTGCATPPPATDEAATADFREANDPLEPSNRVMYDINNGLDTVILRPLAQGYRAVLPAPARNSVHNMLTNMGAPVVLANDMLQGKPAGAGDTLMRFLINSTIGVGGLFDVAKEWGWPAHENGFATTLALWGVDEGPYLFLPVLGPSSPRDLTGFGADFVTDPWQWVGSGLAISIFDWTRMGLSAIDERERVLDSVDSIKKTALDPYATFRSLYRQHRDSLIKAIREDRRATPPNWFAPSPAATPAR